MTKLIQGKVPPRAECPFREKCTNFACFHKGVNHTVPFSCGLARLFDLLDKRRGVK